MNFQVDARALTRGFAKMAFQMGESSAAPAHAQRAMQAAKKLRRARRQSQKEKMGHEVCRHLLRMLEEPQQSARGQRGPQIERAVPIPDIDERQASLAF